MPLVRPRVLGRPRSRSAGLGRGRRGDGRGGVSRAALPRGGRDRGRHARRADAAARLRASRPARRAWRLLLLARGRDRGALERRGAPGSRLDRCARRPEHAGDVTLGQRLGDAVADGARRRRRPRAGRGADRRPQPRPARGRVHCGGRDPHRRRRDRTRARGGGRGVRRSGRRLARAGRPRGLHARAGRATPDRDREVAGRDRCAEANRRARLHRTGARRGQRAQARTACRALGL